MSARRRATGRRQSLLPLVTKEDGGPPPNGEGTPPHQEERDSRLRKAHSQVIPVDTHVTEGAKPWDAKDAPRSSSSTY